MSKSEQKIDTSEKRVERVKVWIGWVLEPGGWKPAKLFTEDEFYGAIYAARDRNDLRFTEHEVEGPE